MILLVTTVHGDVVSTATPGAPLVSVIIPTFNRAHCVWAAIASVAAQSVQDLEIVVVDDASSDGTHECLRDLAGREPRLRVLRHKTNRGVSATRNTGIEAARADYVAFLDSDDMWRPSKLERQLDKMAGLSDEARGKTFCLSYFHTLYQGDLRTYPMFTDNKGSTLHYHPAEIEYLILSRKMWLCPGGTLLAHRDAIRRNGLFDTRTGYGEDTEYIVRHLVSGGKVEVVPSFLMTYDFPSPNKTYPGEAFHTKYMLASYENPIRARWGDNVANEFSASLLIDGATMRSRQGQWHAAAFNLLRAATYSPQLALAAIDSTAAGFYQQKLALPLSRVQKWTAPMRDRVREASRRIAKLTNEPRPPT